MELKNLETFIQVAELNSFTRAAVKLGYSQPTVSFQIRQLELELGIQLFDRIGHTVRLTEEGHEALRHAQQICRACQEMSAGAGRPGEKEAVIRLAMADSLRTALLGKWFALFRQRYPHIAIQITAAGTADLFRLLDQNEADVVCTLDSHIYDTRYIVAGEEKIGVHFVAPAEWPLSFAAEVTVEELLHQPFLLTEKGMSYRRLMDETLARRSLEVQPVLETGRADLICTLAEENAGIGFLPDYVTQECVNQGTLVRLNVPDCRVVVWKQILYRREKWLSLQMQAMIRHLSEIKLNP